MDGYVFFNRKTMVTIIQDIYIYTLHLNTIRIYYLNVILLFCKNEHTHAQRKNILKYI